MNDSTQEELTPDSSQIDNDSSGIKWTCHPVKRKPWLSIGVTVLVITIIALVYNTTQSIWFGLLAFVVMYVSLAKFYLPTHYQLSEKNVTIKTTTQTIQKPWKDFRSAYPDKNGILLSPFTEPTRLENFRGLFLMFNNNRDDVVAFVNSHISKTPDDTNSEVRS